MYNKSLNAPYIIVTNGLEHGCMHIPKTGEGIKFLSSIPRFEEIIE
jgi:hypothetical protein